MNELRNTRPFLKGMGLALVILVPIIVVIAGSGADPESAGERAGELAAAPLLGGLVVGVWAWRASRRWRALDYVLRFLLCTVVFFALNGFGQRLIRAGSSRTARFDSVPLTEVEKQGLSVMGGWARHRTLGFITPLGGEWSTDSEAQNQLNSQLGALPGAFSWVLQQQSGDEQVVIYVLNGVEMTEAEFRAMARGMTKGFEKQGVQTQKDAVQWTSRLKDYRYAARTSDGWYAKTRCVPSESKRTPYIVCIQTLSPDSAGLDAARDHLKITALR